MKRFLSLFLLFIIFISTLSISACNKINTNSESEPENSELIAETPYPIDCLRINGIDIEDFVIVSNVNAGGVMYTAAKELQKYIELSTGKKLSIIRGSIPSGTNRILIDETRISDDSTMGVYSDDDGLVLAGTAKQSALYAVYHFLEEFLDWRFFTSDTEVCYENSKIDLANINYTFTLPYKIREIFAYDYLEPWISVKRYQNGERQLGEDMGGSVSYCPNGIHTLGTLAETGYEADQPCLNNRQNLENIRKNIRAFLNSNPDVISIHISQNDNERYCKCEECLADIEYYGAPSGTIIEMLNYICEDLETYKGGIYSDVLVITFAYRYSLTAPENIVCHDNVMIEYTIIDLCHQHPLSYPDCDVNETFLRNNREIFEQMKRWSKISKQCYLYDYGANFRYYYPPFPNFDTLLENYKILTDFGAWGYINLGNRHTKSAEFGELRWYLYAKLTENPNMTEEEYENHINEFLKAYYGEGWTYIKKYLYFVQTLSDETGNCFGVYSSPEMIFGDHAFAPFNDKLIEWFDNAEKLAENAKELEHIRRLRISMDYLRIGAIHKREMESGDESRINNMVLQVKDFWDSCTELGCNWITEMNTVPTNFDTRPDLYELNPRKIIWIHSSVYKD